jgi:large conductance mechanosensitive channel
MWKEFKEFAVKGNVIDLAVAVVIGGAFGKIVTSLVNDLLMPVISLLTSGVNFTAMAVKVGNVVFAYGNFMQSIVDFVLIAFSIFLAVKLLNKAKKKEETNTPAAPTQPSEQQLLTEIRDLLKEQQSK